MRYYDHANVAARFLRPARPPRRTSWTISAGPRMDSRALEKRDS